MKNEGFTLYKWFLMNLVNLRAQKKRWF